MLEGVASTGQLEWEEGVCIFCGPNAGKEIVIRCPDRLNGIPGSFTAARCEQCGLVFQDPRPTESSVRFAYPDSYHVYQPPAGEPASNKWKQLATRAVLSNYFGYSTPCTTAMATQGGCLSALSLCVQTAKHPALQS